MLFHCVARYLLNQYRTVTLADRSSKSIFIVGKIAWAMMPYYYLAAPGTSRESLTGIKITNVFMIFLTGAHIALMYKYHNMNTPQQQYPRRLWKVLHEEHGWQGAHWLGTMTALELVLDAGLLITAGGTAFCIHNFIMRKMVVVKKMKALKQSAALAAPAVEAAAPKATAVKKRVGRA
ncbi:hypothetical protein QJQ45_022314 [Haematococcus lacustris]|nr:hypothetical protein QJQ45_022314 [Haematococcus lacustris]